MQALPPPLAYQCVKPADVKSGSTFLTISGRTEQVAAFLGDVQSAPAWKAWTVDADAASNGTRFLRLRADINIPFRSIGGLIYTAQRRRLALAMSTDPSICEIEEN